MENTEKTSWKIICGAPVTIAINELMMKRRRRAKGFITVLDSGEKGCEGGCGRKKRTSSLPILKN